MTITVTQEHLYIGIIAFLMVLQLFQWRSIHKLKKECDRIWEQLGTLVAGVSNQIISIQKDINNKEDKKAG
jgi:hypothetical protein